MADLPIVGRAARDGRSVGMLAAGVAGAFIAAATLAPGSGERSAISCFACGDRWLTDAISNVALFMPFGAAMAWWRRQIPSALAVSVLLSVAVEVLQYLEVTPGRTTSAMDVLANSTGALVGAAVLRMAPMLLSPTPAVGALLSLSWAVLSAAVLFGTSFLVGGTPSLDSTRRSYAPSSYPHVPDLPWYEDLLDSAFVDEVVIRRGRPGPVIVETVHPQGPSHVAVHLRGRDETTGFVPVLYVHLPKDSAPILLLGVHDEAAELRVARRTWAMGLGTIGLSLPGTLTGRRYRDGVPTTLGAELASGRLTLWARGASVAESASVVLRPTLGWALIQSVVPVYSSWGIVLSAVWCLLLSVPIGWWASGRRRWTIVVLGVTTLLGASAAGSHFFGVSTPGWLHTTLLLLGMLLGVFARSRYRSGLLPHASIAGAHLE